MTVLTDKVVAKGTNSLDELIFATRYLVQVNFTFDLSVSTDSFKGTTHFCVRKDQIESFCKNLLNLGQIISTRIDDNDSDGFVEFLKTKEGEINIKGQVGGTHDANYLNFEFQTDFKLTGNFSENFAKLLEYVDDTEYEEKYNSLYRK